MKILNFKIILKNNNNNNDNDVLDPRKIINYVFRLQIKTETYIVPYRSQVLGHKL